MNEEEIKALARSGCYEGAPLNGKIEETHISWVILTAKFVFKIKRPVKYSFLDFSTLSRREKFCQEELMLNRRLSEIYLAVLPVRKYQGRWYLGEGKGEVVDYAIQMKRMALSRKMDRMLRQEKVTQEHLRILAETVASFHARARIVRTSFDRERERSVFNDIYTIRAFAQEQFGQEYAVLISQSIAWSDTFLQAHEPRIRERIASGFKRDVHGDLHSGNIFLYRQPVIFDCIEFNKNYRQIDVISEIAFLCMDMEVLGQPQLASAFLSVYSGHFSCIQTTEDEQLFRYYKCFRANIRAKVHAISAQQTADNKKKDRHLEVFRIYLEFIRRELSLY